MEEITIEKKQENTTEYRFNVEFYVFQERSVYIAYCPSLDISTSGKDIDDAIANFYDRLSGHVDWCVKHNTLIDDLIDHGWKVNDSTITAPSFSVLLKNEEFREILAGDIPYQKIVTPEKVVIPA